MSYNKTLLWSGSASSSCSLSESVSNFRRIQIVLNEYSTIELPSVVNVSNMSIDGAGGSWGSDVYTIKNGRVSISSDGKTISVDGFTIIGSYSSNPHYWGNNTNNTNNRKQIVKVYGIDRINYTEVEGAGSPGTNWRKYNETLLWSGSNTSPITLSESASNFERLRILEGTSSTAQYYREVAAPLSDGDKLTLQVINSESTSIYNYGWSRWTWSDNMTKLTSEYGKSWRNTGTGNGNFTSALNNNDNDFNKRPILEIVGINRL